MGDVEEEKRLLDSPSHENEVEDREVEFPIPSEKTTGTCMVGTS